MALATLLGGTAAAYAQAATADAYSTALQVYAAGSVEVRSFMEQCPLDAFGPAAVEDDWDVASARLIATLWASGVAAETVRGIESEFERRIPNVECAPDDFLRGRVARVREAGWAAGVGWVIESLGLQRVETPATPKQWGQVKALFAEEREAEARLLECMTALDPMMIPVIVKDWNDILVRTGEILIGAGLPRDEVVAEIEASDTSVIWALPASPEARLALREPCIADEAWQSRYYEFRQGRLRYETESILAAQP